MNKDYDIRKTASQLALSEEQILPYGFDKAKIDLGENYSYKKRGKLILCTAITPTKAGEGKTTTAIGLADALKSMGKNAITCLREPSLGPVFGVKGGGAGGGEATLYPEEDINLHFTGDMHAITSVNNLIAALIDNELYQNSPLNVDSDRIIFPRCMDMNDRSLRSIETCLDDKKAIPHHSSFVITAASEVMACFCLAKDEEDFLDRIENITVAYDKSDKPIFVKALECRTAIRKLIHTALLPNLVQSKYHTPSIVHGGPFANIAHGTNSIIATKTALSLSDYVVTESGFGSDLGMEKYMDIVAPISSYSPDLVVCVCSIRALKLHGGVKFEELNISNPDAVKIGLDNLKHHIRNVKKFGVPCLIAINRFEKDTEEEIQILETFLKENRIPYALNSSYLDGPKGAIELATEALHLLEEEKSHFAPIVKEGMSIQEKIMTISKEIYGCKDVEYTKKALDQIQEFEKSGYDHFSVCISKTPNSLSDDPHLLNDPKDTTLHIREFRLFTGARFIVPLSGDVFTMPGLPKIPASKKMNRL